LSNPAPEIQPADALAAGAAYAADGKSVNNILGFPGIFRGAVDANVPRIIQEVLVAASREIAASAPSFESPWSKASAGRIFPDILNPGIESNLISVVFFRFRHHVY